VPFVPDLNYIKFLQLIGIEQAPARPARAELTFTLARPDLVSVIIPMGTQCAASDGGTQPLIFETDEALIALGATLKAVQVFDGFSYSVATTANSAANQWYYPFGQNAREGSALLLGFDSPVAFSGDEINLAVSVYTQGSATVGHQCNLDVAGIPPPATLAWEYWDSQYWQPLSLIKDQTRSLTMTGHIYFDGPGAAAVKAQIGNVADSLYWIRVRLVQAGYDSTPRLTSVRINTVSATQAQTFRDEILGGSDGRPSQAFRLANAPVVDNDSPATVVGADGLNIQVTSLQLEVDEGGGFLAWQEVSDFLASGPDAPHYTLDHTTGDILFGDGRRGRIPVANPANPNANIVARLYRSGGGAAGNTGAGTITTLETFVDSVASVTNLLPAIGGSDEETLDDAKLRAPQVLKSRDRAVTADDFEYLAIATPTVRIRRARALPLAHPKFPGVPIPGVVTVIVVPDSDAPNPSPGDSTLALVCAQLNAHRLLTSEVYVVPPTYHLVKIEADLVVSPSADLAEVQRGVTGALTTFFHPLVGGSDGTGWPFGGAIYFSDVTRVVLQIPGVARIRDNQLLIWLDRQRQLFCRDVTIGAGELLFSQGHDVRVSYN
jgi:predicted phage baseplate assembly protein